MTREGHSRNHKSPSYKLHNHPNTCRYRYTYIMHNAITQQGIGNVKQTLPYLRNVAQVRNRKIKWGTWRRTLIHALKKRLRGREKEKITLEGMDSLIY